MKKLLQVLAVLALTVTLFGCSTTEKSLSGKSEDELVMALTDWQNQDFTNFKMEMILDMSSPDGDFDLEMVMEYADQENYHILYSMGDGTDSFDIEQYSIKNEDGTYTSYSYMSLFEAWFVSTEESMPENEIDFDAQEMVQEDFNELLEYTGTETIDGVEYDVLTLKTDAETIEKLYDNDIVDQFGTDDLSIEELTYKLYFDQDGNFTMLRMVVAGEDTNIDATMKFYDVGNVGEIIVPQDVIDQAEDMGSMFGF